MEQKMISILREVLETDAAEPFTLQDRFREHAHWDSLTQLGLIAALDEHFGVQLEWKEFEPLQTIQDLIDAVNKVAAP